MARSPQQILQNDYLIARAKIIEVAAVLDRIDRAAAGSTEAHAQPMTTAAGSATDSIVQSRSDASRGASAIGSENAVYSDPSYQKIQNAIVILSDKLPDKTRRIQELLSRPYTPNWMQQFQLPAN
jgi:hypothetical protein